MEAVMIAGRELLMAFDLRAWVEDLEPRFGCFEAMVDQVGGQNKPITAGMDMLLMLINAGQRHQGSKERITRDWLLDNVQPVEAPALISAGQEVIYRSFRQEEKAEEGPVDEVLAELAKKETGSA